MRKNRIKRKSFLLMLAVFTVLVIFHQQTVVFAAGNSHLPVDMDVKKTPTPPGDEDSSEDDEDDKPEKPYHKVTVRVIGEGFAWSDKTWVRAGETFTVDTKPAKGWRFVRFIDWGESGVYLMPDEDVEIVAVFEKIPPKDEPDDDEDDDDDPTPKPDDNTPDDTPSPRPDDQEPPKTVEPKPHKPVKKSVSPWIPIAAAGAAAATGGGAWYFFVFWRRRKFHGIFSGESIPGTKEWGIRDQSLRSCWFIPELVERLNHGAITWEEYTDTLVNCGVGTKFPSDTRMTIRPASGEAISERASERKLFERLSLLSGAVSVQFTSKRTGMDFTLELNIPHR